VALGPGRLGAVDSWSTVAAVNNAEWCDCVCRAQGVETRFDENAWTGRTRTPPFYPDAVTLVPTPRSPVCCLGSTPRRAVRSRTVSPPSICGTTGSASCSTPTGSSARRRCHPRPRPAPAGRRYKTVTSWRRGSRRGGRPRTDRDLRAELLNVASVTIVGARRVDGCGRGGPERNVVGGGDL